MIDKFIFFLPLVQGDLACIEHLARKFVEQQAEQNVIYTEVRYSPHVLTPAGSFEFDATGAAGPGASARDDDAAKEVVDAVTRGLRAGCAAHAGIEVAQILCFIDGKPQWASALTELASSLAGDLETLAASPAEAISLCPVVAVDVAAGEAHFVAESGFNGSAHREAMCACAKIGLGLTNHAGESGPAGNVALACSGAYGGARRIGHGYAAIAEAQSAVAAAGSAGEGGGAAAAALVDALRALSLPDGITLELCPTSSRATGGWTGKSWTEHPLAFLTRLRAAAEAAGASDAAAALPRVAINSDDPAVFGSSITEEIALAVREMGLDADGLRCAMRNAADAAFLPDGAKKRLKERLEVAWESWLAAPA